MTIFKEQQEAQETTVWSSATVTSTSIKLSLLSTIYVSHGRCALTCTYTSIYNLYVHSATWNRGILLFFRDDISTACISCPYRRSSPGEILLIVKIIRIERRHGTLSTSSRSTVSFMICTFVVENTSGTDRKWLKLYNVAFCFCFEWK